MEKCKLTQRPCREAIMEIINEDKNRESLQHIYQLAKLFQAANSESSDLTEEEWTKYLIIIKVLMLDDVLLLKFVDNVLYHSMK